MSIFYRHLQKTATVSPAALAWSADEQRYNYAELLQAVDERAATLQADRRPLPIRTSSVTDQWLSFLAGLAIGRRPIICHPDMSEAECAALLQSTPPREADFGVLSSGTTGRPKLLWRTEASWADGFPEQNVVFDIRPGARLFFHGSLGFTGNLNALAAVFLVGGAGVTVRRHHPRAWLRASRAAQADTLYLLPVKLRQWTRLNEPAPGIHSLFTGSQALDPTLATDLRRLFPNARCTLYYGAGELSHITYCSLAEWEREPGIVGRPFPSVTVETEGDHILVTTPFGVIGTQPRADIGDRGEWTAGGMLRFRGRSRAVINCGGKALSVPAIEAALRNLPSLADVAIFAVPDPLRGEVPAAAYVPADRSARPEQEAAAAGLTPLERPRYWLRCDRLPLNSCSKIDIPQLQHRWQELYGNKKRSSAEDQ